METESLNQWGPKWRELKPSQSGQCSKLNSKHLGDEGRKDTGETGGGRYKACQLSPVQAPPDAWAAWPQRSGRVCSSAPSWPPQPHSTWGRGGAAISHTQLGPALPLPHSALPLCVEGASGVQQQEELPLGLGAVPREEIMLQGDWASNSADHIDLATLQPPE